MHNNIFKAQYTAHCPILEMLFFLFKLFLYKQSEVKSTLSIYALILWALIVKPQSQYFWPYAHQSIGPHSCPVVIKDLFESKLV